MPNKNYRKLVDGLKDEIFGEFEVMPALDNVDYLDYLKVKANLQYFTQDTLSKDPFDFFKHTWFYDKLTERDQKQSNPLEHVTMKGQLPAPDQPAIYCSFHLGSYRLISYLLTKNNTNFSLLVSKEETENNTEVYTELIDSFIEKNDSKGSFNVLCAENERIGFQLIRELKKGNSILVYLDGNNGIGGVNRKDDKLVPVDFLGRNILARKGISFISHFINVPIVPIFSYRPEVYNQVLEVLPPIYPNKEMEREQYAQQTTQQLFDLFSDYLVQYPAEWNGWFYFNNFVDKSTLDSNSLDLVYQATTDYTFNQNRYSFFVKEMFHYLFDGNTQNCIKLPKALWELLLKVKKGELEYTYLPNLLKEKLFNQLLQKGILVPST